MSTEVTLETVEPLHLAAIHDRTDQASLPDLIGKHVGTLLQAFKAHSTPFGRCVIVYGNEPQPPALVLTDAGFPIDVGWEVEPSAVPEQEPIAAVATPAGTVATATHLGPYNQMGEAHNAIHDWCKAQGRTLAGPSWEVYAHPREGEETRTDVYYLLA